MKAIAIVPGTAGARIVDRPEPSISTPDEVKLKVIRVGICGTDRGEVSGGRADAPDGQKELVIGHEMFGQVVELGSSVTCVKMGDFAVFTVRRGCAQCPPCLMGRADMCQTGKYRERGIHGLDGYQTEFVVDKEQYVVRVPVELEAIGVLMEPLSVVEKAIDEAMRLQVVRCPEAAITPAWIVGRRCLVAGLGPVGLLASMVLRLRGADVYGLDVVDSTSARPKWFDVIGGHYVDGRLVPADQVEKKIAPMDLVLDASGIASLEFNLLDALGRNGAYVVTGIPGGDRPLQIDGAELVRQLVLDNQVMLGSVNAARGHFQMAVDDLSQAQLRWGTHVAAITPWNKDLAHWEFAQDRILLAVPKGHLLTKRGKIRLRDLRDIPFIWFQRSANPTFDGQLVQECVRGGLSTPRIVQEATDRDTLIGFVQCRLGIAWLTESIRWQCPRGIVLLPVTDMNVRLPFNLIWKRDNSSPLLKKFVAQVQATKVPARN
jgi:threonine dehydrogenase-like Zn-dependent dehydrogenase